MSLSLSNILLGDDQLLVSPVSSSSVVFNFGSVNLSYGRIALVNQTSDRYKAGQTIMYSNLGQISVTYLTIQYYLINQNTIKLVAP